MHEDTRPYTLNLPVHLIAVLEAPSAAASPDALKTIGRYILASWIEELEEDSPEHVGWISLFGRTLLAYPGSLIPESYRWPFEMLADMDPNLDRPEPPKVNPD